MIKYDLVIFGGGTAGTACAYTAGRLGLKTLLIEERSFLGGSITSSLVIPAMKTSNNAINTDFFNILYKELEKESASITYSDSNKGWFNPHITKIILDKLIKSASVDVIFEAKYKIKKTDLLSYIVTIENDNLLSSLSDLFTSIETNIIVDATGDAKICKILNCEFLNNKDESQPVNLRFIMSGVNSGQFVKWLMNFDTNRDITTSAEIDNKLYCSTAYTWDTNTDWRLKPLFADAIDKGIITEADSNYFQIFSVAGAPDSIAFNAPRILETKLSRTEAYISGRESILRLSKFCKAYLPGFDNAYISSIADSLGIRVSNRVKGQYIYTKQDLLSGKKFSNPVVVSNYPVDIHSKDKDSSKLEKVYQEYQLPVESLIVNDNLYVIGRCISADFEAQGALRIIPSCFSMGEGLAKYLKAKLSK